MTHNIESNSLVAGTHPPQGTIHPELFRPWQPATRAALLGVMAIAGILIWAHATLAPDASWYSMGETNLAEWYRLLGVFTIVVAAMCAIPCLLEPWAARRAASSPICITVRQNELRAEGRGRKEGLYGVHATPPGAGYSTKDDFIADAAYLAKALDELLESLSLRAKPFVLVAVDAGSRSPSPAEAIVIKQVFAGCSNVLDFQLVEVDILPAMNDRALRCVG